MIQKIKDTLRKRKLTSKIKKLVQAKILNRGVSPFKTTIKTKWDTKKPTLSI